MCVCVCEEASVVLKGFFGRPDLIFAFIETFWGSQQSQRIASIIEHVPRAVTDDLFSQRFSITPIEAQPCPKA